MNLPDQKYSIEWLANLVHKDERVKFLFFWGHTKGPSQVVGDFCFSQWYASSFVVDGFYFKTSEHWMMAQKAKLFSNMDLFYKIIECNTPGEAKQLGRQVENFDEAVWIEHRFEIVRLGNIHKFTQNLALRDYLIQTGNRILVEASPVDSIWGIGLSKDSKDIEDVSKWIGLNLLGFALMEVRDFIRAGNSLNSV